ncbi:MAG: hydrogenobyrinic acid a,c-diamide synthase (glutamine-hydrolyzing) [Gammaproteobacteria bacterium]|nr:hydrogenobyrinic acid a,c-diamide synthase (glutamine-hydrolyzing) [Gammaproteobacteria bacterium]
MSHILISAAHKSSGKTTISIGLTAAFNSLGKKVQSFKKGPDYIDPMWLGRATNRPCYNLDFYTMQKKEILQCFNHHMSTAELGIIEGNKGLYDGLDLDGSNSNAALACLLDAPVVLVIDSRGMTRGIAPLVLGYQNFDTNINIQGVILNQVGGSRHESKLRSILEHYTDVKVLGAVHKNDDLNIDERHLGLIPSNEENTASNKIEQIASCIKDQVNLDQILEIAKHTSFIQESRGSTSAKKLPDTQIKIGIFRDEAFGFYYPDDLEVLQNSGAEIVFINSLVDNQLPEIDGLIIGGGFPETQMNQLSNNQSLMQSVKSAIESGLPTYAECGGLMYLARSIKWNNKTCKMAGVIQGEILMHKRPQGRGYIQLQETGSHPWKTRINNEHIFAHEFHYSELTNINHEYKYAYNVLRGAGIDGKHDGLIYKNLLANYAHLRNTQNNEWAVRFIEFIKTINHRNTTTTFNSTVN